MINVKELRLGNYVIPNTDDIPWRVSAIARNYVYVELMTEITKGETEINPIPLDEDWLLKFGMEYYDGFSSQRFIRLNKHECDSSKLTYSDKEGFLRFNNGDDKGTSLIPYVKYVHQLQNLYYALTGEELTINEI